MRQSLAVGCIFQAACTAAHSKRWWLSLSRFFQAACTAAHEFSLGYSNAVFFQAACTAAHLVASITPPPHHFQAACTAAHIPWPMAKVIIDFQAACTAAHDGKTAGDYGDCFQAACTAAHSTVPIWTPAEYFQAACTAAHCDQNGTFLRQIKHLNEDVRRNQSSAACSTACLYNLQISQCQRTGGRPHGNSTGCDPRPATREIRSPSYPPVPMGPESRATAAPGTGLNGSRHRRKAAVQGA